MMRQVSANKNTKPQHTSTHQPLFNKMTDLRFRFSIDRGGTFTDIYCEVLDGSTKKIVKTRVVKLLSEDPSNYKDAPTEGIRRILEDESGIPHPRGVPVRTSQIEFIRMGTTVATNALLERKGERIALVTTAGFADLQRIGNQSRPKIFDLEISRPDLLYESVYEVNERVVLVKEYEEDLYDKEKIFVGKSHEKLFIEKPLDEDDIRNKLREILEQGIKSIAVVLLHSYTFPDHELKIKKIAEELGFEQISISSEVMPMIRAVPRGGTTCVDAYLTPIIKKYLRSFASGFDEGLAKVNVSFMQSDGGLTPMDRFFGNRAILSGPAGGVVGYATTSQSFRGPQDVTAPAVIGFDMGGTSTDVSRFCGVYEHVFETTTAGITIQSPQLDINTVAAGGGSRLFYRNGLFVVGPESAGAHPGPICYRKSGYLAVTDANVLLGRIQPHLFPAIFGPHENEPLDYEATRQAFVELTKEINQSNLTGKIYTPDEVAHGFIRVANEAMARPIRNLTTMKGYDVTKHWLGCFGGAGPQHCCAIAKSLGMRKVLVHRYSGILSAYGLSLADIVVEKQEPFNSGEIGASLALARQRLDVLESEAKKELLAQGFTEESISVTHFLNCRYQGTDTCTMTKLDETDPSKSYSDVFIENYRREYGFELKDRAILVDDVRVRVTGQVNNAHNSGADAIANQNEVPPPAPKEIVSVYFDSGRVDTPVFILSDLVPFQQIAGPAIIVQDVATVVVEPGCSAKITASGDIEIIVEELESKEIGEAVDPIYLSVFGHRFMGIAEQMGRTLQRTSISVNIKERLDFSCALFDAQGGLVANAPHLPVHLGAMSEAVRSQIRYWKNDIQPGDVLVSNHPQLAGGSHLPDITVMTPIFWNGEIVFFVASRGHHADVGGIAPGSMPPLSKTLQEEGAAIVAFKLVKAGAFQEEGIVDLLTAPGKIPGNYGARKISDNLSDLKAQVAANQKGAALMHELVQEYGLSVVLAYMRHIQACAEQAVRDMLISFSKKEGMKEIDQVTAEDYLDDGTKIKLTIEINRQTGSAVFDFTGTGHEIFGNLNAPPAVTASAIIYCLRCLLTEMDIPLNQGCLAPIEIKIPTNSILNPSCGAAVVGGNVLTSQRVTDVVLKAFKACAASQGCMNNLTFGDSTMGYYETIAGGAGAGPTWHGCSGVHTHMTNTRITDVEILERRYPVIVRQFSLRNGSGGVGQYHGGDGVIRALEFTKPLVVSILSERRAFEPYGLAGGENGSRGLNLVEYKEDQRVINLGGKNTIHVKPGDKLIIHTPGGGGYGKADQEDAATPQASSQKEQLRMTSGSLNQYTLNQESV